MAGMSDYISREDALTFARKAHAKGLNILDYLEEVPAADVRPVVHGRWIEDDSGVVICSNCGEEHEWDQYRASFCDNCGADMRGGNEQWRE